jgi:hypothetical protein
MVKLELLTPTPPKCQGESLLVSQSNFLQNVMHLHVINMP